MSDDGRRTVRTRYRLIEAAHRHRRLLWLASLFLIYALIAFSTLPLFGEWRGIDDYFNNPFLSVARETILQHKQVPLWNPYAMGGFSLVAAPLAEHWRPSFLVYLLLGVHRGVLTEYVLLSALGGVGLYLLSRQVGASREAAVLPGIVFVTSNAMPTYVLNGWFNFMGIGLVPLGLWAFSRAATRPSVAPSRHELILIAVMAHIFLRADHYHFVLAALLLAVFGPCVAIANRSWLPVKILCRAGIVTGLVAGIKLVPMLVGGEGIPHFQDVGFSFDLYTFVEALVVRENGPDLVGSVGPAALALAVVGLAWAGRSLWPHAVCLAFFVLFCLGSNLCPRDALDGELYVAGSDGFSLVELTHVIPGLDTLHSPSRALPFVAVLLAMFASKGLDAVVVVGRRVCGHIRPSGTRTEPVAWILCLVVCCVVGFPELRKSRALLTQMQDPGWLELEEAPRFRQVRLENRQVSASLYPILNIGNLNTNLQYNVPGSLRAVDDPEYAGEERWMGDGRVELLRWTPNRLVYEVGGSGRGRLVVNQRYADGWRVTGPCDTVVEPYEGLISVNTCAPGTVVLRFFPSSFVVGLVTSGLGLALAGWMLAGARWRRLGSRLPDRPTWGNG